jgi:hypothetical protein
MEELVNSKSYLSGVPREKQMFCVFDRKLRFYQFAQFFRPQTLYRPVDTRSGNRMSSVSNFAARSIYVAAS